MELKLCRIAYRDTYTIGKLYINGRYFCDTLEDPVRDLNNISDKIPGKTAIPAGIYTIILNMSHRFGRLLPLLLNVPYFEGIRMHAGNTDIDTHGCILVGENKEKGKVLKSRIYENELVKILLAEYKQKIKITIEIV